MRTRTPYKFPNPRPDPTPLPALRHAGEFQLMTYRITENVNLPFRVLPVVKELGRTRLEINIKASAHIWRPPAPLSRPI
eukprot:2208251-Pleurochrysis_carterae.AAC.1